MQTLGLTVKKDDFSEWYTQVIQKSGLADYSSVSGCIVFKPYSYAIWERIQAYLDNKLKDSGVQNAYFPMLIPESLLMKEKQHVEGFTPEVAWVTHAGESKLNERLAIRPTSETIMYDSYSQWIRSHNDLPMRINQWNSVIRWEFKHAVPFLRTREFLWQEGHSVFATQKEADAEVREILGYYKETFENLLAVPVLSGKKTDSEKFAGADYSLSLETFLPVGKAIQCATSHSLGQNFSKAFNIAFQDPKGKKQYGWQNSWGFTTRSIGIMVIMHGDDKGLVLPPMIAPVQVVIIPIIFEKSKKHVLDIAQKLKTRLKPRTELDVRDYSPGWKFNEWELKGVPIRIEIGPKDVAHNQAVLVRRDTGAKETVKLAKISKRVDDLLVDIQHNLFTKAKSFMTRSMVAVETWPEFLDAVKSRKWVVAKHCGDTKCEQAIKDKTEGVKTTNIQKLAKGKCVHCSGQAMYEVMFAKSY